MYLDSQWNRLFFKKESSVEGEVTIGAGRPLFKQGEKGGDLYFIAAGQVDLTVRNEETGGEVLVATVGEKSVIGTMSFLEEEPRSATAITKTEVKVIKISQMQRDKMLKSIPSWLAVLIKDLSSSLRRQNGQYLSVTEEKNKLEKKLAIKEKQAAKLEEDLASSKNELKEQKAAADKAINEAKTEIANLKKKEQELTAQLAKKK